jgi:4'-phosphopantetheinyl transferase
MIHVTLVRTDIDDALLARLEAMLTSAEQARAARYRQVADRRRHVVARAALKALLAERLGVDMPEVRLAAGPFGKPVLAARHDEFDTPTSVADAAPHFNLSHSGDLALIALAPVPVGIDIERDMPADAPALAQAWFTPAEQARLAGGQTDFLDVWTAREAVLKAMGTGLSGEPDVARHAVASLEVAAPYRAAVAVRGAMLPRTITCLDANDIAARGTLRAAARAGAACPIH